MSEDKIPVRVALRCRPLVTKEIIEGCQQCVEFVPNEPQVVVGGGKAFTFDFVYRPISEQESLYIDVVQPLVENIFKGYNATVLAYGQTGSGKTYSMGTVYTGQDLNNDKDLGVIPRAVREIFDIVKKFPEKEYNLKVTFLEIYNEDVLDLLVQSKNRNRDELQIREDFNGDIKVAGLQEVAVKSIEDTLLCLEQGSIGRSTGATAMNTQSSRSHAIFTIHIEQKISDAIVKSKFHLVDLAGSERAKKTRAQGERFKEGVNINRGLLALGNVISALGEEGSRSHVPYRDSKLTRLLQDSLGGNSHTAMIACISPADSNLEETVNTLRYADRARKIKNKPIVNRDPQAAELARLRQLVQELQMHLSPTQLNSNMTDKNGTSISSLQSQIQELETENQKLSKELRNALNQKMTMCEKALLAEAARERLKKKLSELQEKAGLTAADLNMSLDTSINVDLVKEIQDKITEIQAEQQEEVNLYSSDKEEGDTDNGDSPDKFSKEHALRQAEMNRELQDLNRALAVKEDLAKKMLSNETRIHETLLNPNYEVNVKQLEEEVAILQAEKEELSQALRAAQNNPSNKLSEQRRKRLQDLEAQLSQLKKKMSEQGKIIRMKEQTEERVKKLNHEIQLMKQTRVKLIRQMREEADKFRQWRQEKDREVAKLKQQDRKRQFELVKMERMHAKQQNVLRRKMEDAVAVNKRLKNALAKRISITDRRNDMKNPDAIGNKVRNWLTQELELVVSAREATHHLNELIEDRKTISAQLAALTKRREEGAPPRKKVMLGENSSDSSDLDTIEADEQIAELQNDLEMRNVQIADIQQKLLDADQGEKNKVRWESIQSMVEAKCALKWLFDVAARAQYEEAMKNNANRELNNNYKEAVSNLEATRDEMHKMQKHFAEETMNLERKNEDKVLFLLQQLPPASMKGEPVESPNEVLVERLKFQGEEIARLASIREELEQKSTECEALKKELTLVHCKGKKTSLMPDLCDFSGSPVFPATPQVPAKKKPAQPKARFALLDALLDEVDEDNLFEDSKDDFEDDPDWRKTPQPPRRIRKTNFGAKRSSNRMNDSSSDSASENVPPPRNDSKRSSTELKCKCKSTCKTKKCACRKAGIACSGACRCGDSCTNTENHSKNSFSDQSLETSSRPMLSSTNRHSDENGGSSHIKIEGGSSIEESSDIKSRTSGRQVKLYKSTANYLT